jgi:hypothetical protein
MSYLTARIRGCYAEHTDEDSADGDPFQFDNADE